MSDSIRCPSCGNEELTLRIKNVTVHQCTMIYDPVHGFSVLDIGLDADVSWDGQAWCVCDECEFGAVYAAYKLDRLPGRFEVLVTAYDMQETVTVTADTPAVAKRLAVKLIEDELDQVDRLIHGNVEAEKVRLVWADMTELRARGIHALLCDGHVLGR
jgi:hypothetical protein